MKLKNISFLFAFPLVFGSLYADEPLTEKTNADDILIETFYSQGLNQPDALIFTPPEGWIVVDPNVLPKKIKVMVIGKSKKDYPPSINLGMEPFPGTLKEYLKMIKQVNESQGSEWKDLGMIKTQAGNASLSQVDMKTEWGNARLMHVILIRNEQLYILTAAALKEEFPQFYKQFFNSMTSLRFNKDYLEMVASPKKRVELTKAIQSVKLSWTEYVKNLKDTSEGAQKDDKEITFNQDEFQEKHWKPFLAILESDFSDLGSGWKEHVIEKTKNELMVDEKQEKKLSDKSIDNEKFKS